MKFRMKKIALENEVQKCSMKFQTQRIIDNFPISGISMNFPLLIPL